MPQYKLFKTQTESIKEKQKQKYDLLSHKEYGDGRQGTKHTLDQHVVKPASKSKAMVPALSLSNLPASANSPLATDSRNTNSDGVKVLLSQKNLESLAAQKRQKNGLRQALRSSDYQRSFVCSLARFRSEANRLGIRLSEQDYEVICAAFKVLKNIGYG